MKISVCMIVKNEQTILERCLSCAKRFADEIIIVDTGSTDCTKQIARHYTDKIFDFEWVNDFSKARNFSFSKATCDYVMWLDADDVVTDENIKKINDLKKSNKDIDVFMLKYAIVFDEQDNSQFSYYRERILKRNKNFLWKGFVHEAIAPSGKIEYVDIEVQHKKIGKSNSRRNYDIYKYHLKNGEKLDARSQYYFSKEHYYLGKYKACITQLKKYLKMSNRFYPNIVDSYLHIARCYCQLNRFDMASQILLKSFNEIVPTSEIVCLLAEIMSKLGKTQTAIYFYESALNIKPNYESGEFVDTNYYYLIPYLALTSIYYGIDYTKAKDYHELAKKQAPSNNIVIHNNKYF